jgi:hypothetical protein
MTKKKLKIVSLKQIAKSEEAITRVDQQTFYHKTNSLYDDGGKIIAYMIYNSNDKGWLCDCLSFIFNLKDTTHAHTPDCKHIKAIKAKYNIK